MSWINLQSNQIKSKALIWSYNEIRSAATLVKVIMFKEKKAINKNQRTVSRICKATLVGCSSHFFVFLHLLYALLSFTLLHAGFPLFSIALSCYEHQNHEQSNNSCFVLALVITFPPSIIGSTSNLELIHYVIK